MAEKRLSGCGCRIGECALDYGGPCRWDGGYYYASAGEAGTATTPKSGVVHEHATGEAGDAQKEAQ